ncbi:MAG: hypothetical protein IJ832_05480 [Bacteroidaceae bacterium]|nr:hypothetical protein [Bacteroidaceae bacterium]
MKKTLFILFTLLMTVSGAWAQAITVTLVDGTNAPYDTYGTRNNSATPNTLTTNEASGLAGVVLSAPQIDRYNGWWSTYCLALCPSATQTAEAVTFTAPEGYLLLSVNMTAQANSSDYPYDVVFNGSTTTVNGASAKTFSANNILAPSFSFTINHTAASFHASNKWFAVKSLTLQLVKIITNTSQINANKSYVVKCDRSAWAVANNGTALSTIGELNLALSIPDGKQRFAFVTPDKGTNYYLYSVNAGKFLHAESNAGNGGSLVYGPDADKVFFADASSYKANTWRVYLEDNNNNKNINVGGSNQVTIDSWATADAGCAYYLIEAADVDGAALAERLKGPISVTWNVVSEANGTAIATGTSDAYRTETLTLPSDLTRPFCTYEYYTDAACTQTITSFPSDYSGSGTETIYAKYTFSAPFTVSETFNTATWYYAKIRTNKYVVYGDAAPYACTTTKEDGKKGMWAFMGNPYDGIQIVNRYAGSGKYLEATATQPSMTTTATNWVIGNNNGNFTLYASSVGYMNEAGSAGYLKYWNSNYGATDDGSTWRVEAAPSDAEALANLCASYEIASANLDKPGFPTTEAYNTFRSTIEGFTSLEAWDEGINAALTEVRTSTVYPNGTYYIKNRNTGCYAFITDDGDLVPRIKIDNTVSHANNNYLWTVTSDKDAGTCSIVSSLYSTVPFAKGANDYSTITSSNRTVITTLSTELFSSNNGTTGAFYLNGAHNNNTYTGNGEGTGNSHVVNWAYQDSPGSQWIFEPVDLGTAYTVTVEGLNDGGEDAVTLSDGTIVNLGTGTVYLSEAPTTSNITQNEVSGYSIQEGSIVIDGTTVTVTYSPSYDVLIANYWSDNSIADKLANAGQYGYPATDNQYTVALNGVATALAGSTYEGNATNYNNLKTWYAGFLAADVVTPSTGKFYRFKANATGQYMGYAESGKQPMAAEANAAVYFYTSGKQFVNYNSGRYLSGAVGNAVTAVGTDGPAFNFYKSGYSTPTMGTVRIRVADNSNGSIIAWTDGYLNGWGTGDHARCEWIVEDVTELPVTISSVRFATLYSPVALSIPDGVTAYVGTTNNNVINLTPIRDGVIPANTGVILEGEAGTYNFAIATTDGTATSDITGTVAAQLADNVSGTKFVLANGNNGVGFYKYTGTNLGGFRAYLVDGANSSSSGFTFNFVNDDDPTAVESAVKETVANGQYYDLTGRKVAAPQKGQIYIVNGKKVLY